MELFLILLVILYLYNLSKYNKGEYKKESGLEYWKVIVNKGYRGEYKVYKHLKGIKGLNKILVNRYIRKNDGERTEIDLIFIHETGIYVIESKNYNGWIFGNEKNKYWTQTFKTGKKYKFYNPIWQNNTHIKHLSNLLYDVERCNFISIIVFNDSARFKDIKKYSYNVRLINTRHLIKTINEMANYKYKIFDENKILEVYNTIKTNSEISREEKLRHRVNVNNKR